MRKNARLRAAVCRSAGGYKSGLRVSCNRNADSRKTKSLQKRGFLFLLRAEKAACRAGAAGTGAAGRIIFFTSGVYFFTDIDKKPRI